MRFFPRAAENVRLHDRQASCMSAFSNRCLLAGSRRDACRTGVTEYSAGIASDHSALMPADLITLAHFSVSAAMCLPKSVGGPPNGVAPRSASRACILASDKAALIALLRVSITSAGVLLGAQKPPQKLAS